MIKVDFEILFMQMSLLKNFNFLINLSVILMLSPLNTCICSSSFNILSSNIAKTLDCSKKIQGFLFLLVFE